MDCRILQLVLSASLLLPSLSSAQDQPASQANSARPPSAKEVKKREKRILKELSLDDANWLLNEVPDIITGPECRAFVELGTQEEREQFIEIFWRDRNPERDSPVNSVREEHFTAAALEELSFEEFPDTEKPSVRRFAFSIAPRSLSPQILQPPVA